MSLYEKMVAGMIGISIGIPIILALAKRALKSHRRLSNDLAGLFTLGILLVFALAFGGIGVVVLVKLASKHQWAPIWAGVLFLLIGGVIAWIIVKGTPGIFRRGRIKAEHPEEPWLWNSDWASGRISDHITGSAIGTWIFALIWNGISIPGVIAAMRDYLRKHDPKVFIAWIFPAIGVWLVALAIRATARAAHFGKSILTLQTFPASPGGTLTGTIHVEKRLRPSGPVRLHLTCSRISRSSGGAGNNSITTTMVVWEDEQELDGLEPAQMGSDIPVEFAIPGNVPETSGSGTSMEIAWRLEVKAPAPEVNYRTRFDLPVFNMRHPLVLPPPAPVVKFLHHEGQPQPADLAGITVEPLIDGGCVIHFAAARNWGMAIFLTIMGAFFTALYFFALPAYAPLWAKGVSLVVFVSVDLLALNTWLSSATITARPGSLHIDRGWPLLHRRRDIPSQDIGDITLELTTTCDNNVTVIAYYTLKASVGGKTFTLVGDVRGKHNAEYLAGEIKRGLGMGVGATG